MDERREIQPLGEFFSQTADGQAINPCSFTRLEKPWTEALEEVRQIDVRELGEEFRAFTCAGRLRSGRRSRAFRTSTAFVLHIPAETNTSFGSLYLGPALQWSAI